MGAAPLYRPEKVQRTLNTDQFSVSIQKDNRVDIRDLNGTPIVDNAFPEITFANKKPRPLKVDHRRSTRVGINNALGKGNGLRFETGECSWVIATYPGQPYITIDLTYTNDTKKAVEIASISPWTLGTGNGGMVYPGGAGNGEIRMLENATAPTSYPQIVSETSASVGHLLAQNIETGTGLFLGFLSHDLDPAITKLHDRKDPKSGFRRFGASLSYDVPVVLAPGAQLQVGTVYLAIGERDVATSIARFVTASKRSTPVPPLSLAYRHGWQVPTSPSYNETGLKEAMEALATKGGSHGWSHIHLGTAWMPPSGERRVDEERFPSGLPAMVEFCHALGLTIGLTIPLDDLDAAEAVALIRACESGGMDSLEVVVDDPSAAIHAPARLYEALRSANYVGPRPIFVRPDSGTVATLPHWAQASRAYYLPASGGPFLTDTNRMPLQDGSRFSDGQFVTAFSLAALQGLNIRPVSPYAAQSALRKQVLTRLVPPLRIAAKPVDLLSEHPPEQWCLPLKTDAGVWTVLGLFNWNESNSTIHRTPLTAFGLNPDVRYTVYDFWAGKYLGMIQDQLQIEIPAEGVRLLGLRYAESRPMLIASNRDITQGAADHEAVSWSYKDQTLSGRFRGSNGFPYTLIFLVPKPYQLVKATCSENTVKQESEGDTVKLSVTPTSNTEVTWTLQF